MLILDVGGGIDNRAKEFYPNEKITTIDNKLGWDVTERGLPEGDWDLIFCNHFIEHLVDVDLFFDMCKDVMSDNTVLEIATPNLCAWFNRLLFLFGYIPHSYELSYRHNVGKAFDWNKEELGGHIRIFSVQSLVQLLTIHGFRILSVVGEKSSYHTNYVIKWFDRQLSKNPNLASAVRIKCMLP